jgi:hypothetical protein
VLFSSSATMSQRENQPGNAWIATVLCLGGGNLELGVAARQFSPRQTLRMIKWLDRRASHGQHATAGELRLSHIISEVRF